MCNSNIFFIFYGTKEDSLKKIANNLLASVEKLLKRHGGFSEIPDNLHIAWEMFIQSLVIMMFDGEEISEDASKTSSPTTTPTLIRRAVMRKRSGTVGQLPLTRSSSDHSKNDYRLPQPINVNLDSPRGRRKQDNSPKLFRARSITFKKKRKVNATPINFTDTSRILSVAQESWNTILQPHWNQIISLLFLDLHKMESFEFAHHLLSNYYNFTLFIFPIFIFVSFFLK